MPSGCWGSEVTVAHQTPVRTIALTREDAQAWCEAQIAALVAAGRCTSD
jgi:hypothetical protein